MSDEREEEKWESLREELSQPDHRLPNIYDGADVLPKAPVAIWRETYANCAIYSHLTDAEIDEGNCTFTPHKDGYLVEKNADQ